MKKIFFAAALLFSTAAFADKASIDRQLIAQMFTSVNNDYLQPVDNAELAVNGLKAVTELDNNIIITRGTDKFYIYYKKQIKKIVPQPKEGAEINDWVDTVAQIMEQAAQLSEKVAYKDFELPDLMMKKITLNLDKYSHYYSEYDYREDEEKNAIYTLYSERKIEDFLYLRVRIFNKQTAKQIKNSLEKNAPVSGVILDLRGNSGGIFDEALKTADFFTDNEIITYTSGRDGENLHYYTSENGTLYDGKLVVIVDGDTASAAEVLAAGLQEQSRAKLIGTSTFGKGTIQNVIQMNNGGKLVLTTEQFFTPSGKVIHNNGVVPDICTIALNDGYCPPQSRLYEDLELEKAIKLLKNEI